MCFPLLPVSTRHHSIPDFFNAYILVTLQENYTSQSFSKWSYLPLFPILYAYIQTCHLFWVHYFLIKSLSDPPSCNHPQRTLTISVQSTNVWFKFQASHPSVLHKIVVTGAGPCSCLCPKLETVYLILTFKLFLFLIVTVVLFFPVSQTIWTFHSDENNILFWQF